MVASSSGGGVTSTSTVDGKRPVQRSDAGRRAVHGRRLPLLTCTAGSGYIITYIGFMPDTVGYLVRTK